MKLRNKLLSLTLVATVAATAVPVRAQDSLPNNTIDWVVASIGAIQIERRQVVGLVGATLVTATVCGGLKLYDMFTENKKIKHNLQYLKSSHAILLDQVSEDNIENVIKGCCRIVIACHQCIAEGESINSTQASEIKKQVNESIGLLCMYASWVPNHKELIDGLEGLEWYAIHVLVVGSIRHNLKTPIEDLCRSSKTIAAWLSNSWRKRNGYEIKK